MELAHPARSDAVSPNVEWRAMTARVSLSHANRQAHNWLVYEDGYRILTDRIPDYKGILCNLGCGEAPYRAFFEQYVDRYIGIDWSKSLHAIHADIVADLNAPLPMASEFADTVVSISVLEHLCAPQIMLGEACRILKPGGILILQVPWQWWIHEAPHDYFRYTPYGLRYLLTQAGFRDITIEPQSGFFSMWVNKLNYFSLRAWGERIAAASLAGPSLSDAALVSGASEWRPHSIGPSTTTGCWKQRGMWCVHKSPRRHHPSPVQS